MLLPLRKPHRKTRTGCRTCKIRRVKCDESYPACQKCVTMGRICDGYGVWGGGGALNQDSRALSQPVASKSLVTAANTIVYGPAPTSGLRVSSEEQVYLEWFLHGTATKPPRIFNSAFWDHAILQATIHEPMILQALLALSAAHKRHVLDPANRTRDGLVPDDLEIFLLRHYGNAIKGLHNHLNGDGGVLPRSKLFTAAAMCAIFVLTEMMRGRFETAYMHITNGLHIAKQLAKEPGLNPSFAKCFVRFQDQSMLFRRQMATQRSFSALPNASLVPQLRFVSPTEAGHYLDELIEQVAYLAQQKRLIPRSLTASRAMHVNICQYLLACFESWSLACNATLAEQCLAITLSDATAYGALRQRYQTAKRIAEKCIWSETDTAA